MPEVPLYRAEVPHPAPAHQTKVPNSAILDFERKDTLHEKLYTFLSTTNIVLIKF